MMGTGLGDFKSAFLIILTEPMKSDRVKGRKSDREKIFCIHALAKKVEKHSNGWLKFAYNSVTTNQAIVSLCVNTLPLLMKIRDTDTFSKDSLNC